MSSVSRASFVGMASTSSFAACSAGNGLSAPNSNRTPFVRRRLLLSSSNELYFDAVTARGHTTPELLSAKINGTRVTLSSPFFEMMEFSAFMKGDIGNGFLVGSKNGIAYANGPAGHVTAQFDPATNLIRCRKIGECL